MNVSLIDSGSSTTWFFFFNGNWYFLDDRNSFNNRSWNCNSSYNLNSFNDWFGNVMNFSISYNISNYWLLDHLVSWSLDNLSSHCILYHWLSNDWSSIHYSVRLPCVFHTQYFPLDQRFNYSSVVNLGSWLSHNLCSLSSLNDWFIYNWFMVDSSVRLFHKSHILTMFVNDRHYSLMMMNLRSWGLKHPGSLLSPGHYGLDNSSLSHGLRG